MSPAQIALRYARALFETAITPEQKGLDDQDMETLGAIFKAVPSLTQAFTSQRSSAAGAFGLVQESCFPYLGERCARLLGLMANADRLAAIPLLPRAWQNIKQMESGKTELILELARPADAATINAITSHMERLLKGPITIQAIIKPSIKGGFRLLWQNRLLDYSAEGRIRALRTTLLKQ